MNVIRIETQINGDTLYLPQLNALIGKSVEIVVTELPIQPQPEPAERRTRRQRHLLLGSLQAR